MPGRARCRSLHRGTTAAAHGSVRLASWEQPVRGNPCAVPEAAELGPYYIRRDASPTGGGIEAAVGACQDPGRIPEDRGHPFDAVSHHLRMLDDVGQRIDDAGHENLVVVQRMRGEAFEFVGMARACKRQIKSADV